MQHLEGISIIYYSYDTKRDRQEFEHVRQAIIAAEKALEQHTIPSSNPDIPMNWIDPSSKKEIITLLETIKEQYIEDITALEEREIDWTLRYLREESVASLPLPLVRS